MDFRIFAITVSPPHRKVKPEWLYNEDKCILTRELNKVSRHYILYPEFDINSRLHYHGLIKIHDMTKWHKQVHHVLQRQIGFIKIDQIKSAVDHLRYLCYCRKNYTSDMFKPIIYARRKRIKKQVGPSPLDQGIMAYFMAPVDKKE